jgi:hypothetical protein
MFTDNTPVQPVKEIPTEEIRNSVAAKPLPVEARVGSVITFTNTLSSNMDDFQVILQMEVARRFGLDDPAQAERLCQDPKIADPIKKELAAAAIRSFRVVEELKPVSRGTSEPQLDHNPDFFDRFYYLENSGIAEVSDNELEGVDKVYIGGGVATPAFRSLEENGVYGDVGDNPTYVATDYETAMSHMNDEEGEDKAILVEISLAKLRESRRLLRDPESLYIESESGKTFIAFHGIPAEAIERVLVLSQVDAEQGED